MPDDIDTRRRPETPGSAIVWDLVAPIIIAAIPFGAFRLIGLLTRGLDKPEAAAPRMMIAAIVVTQTIGIVALAFLILMRFEQAFGQLHLRSRRRPVAWRRLALRASIACLLLTEILASVAAAFAGAGFLLVAAVPTFLAYLACKGIAFAGLPSGPSDAR